MLKWIPFFILSCALLHGNEPSFFITEDYQKAERISYEYGLPMVLVFTGSDWSTESKTFLNKCLFSLKQAHDFRYDFVFVWIDFPEFNTRPMHIVEQDFYLKEQFQIHQFPIIILLDPKGKEITRLGDPSQKEFISLIKERLFIYEHLTDKWENVKETKDEALLFSCYKEAQTLGSEYLKEEIVAFALEHQICAPILFEQYVNLVNQGKRNQVETRQLRQLLLIADSQNKKGIREQMALFDFQQHQNAFPLEIVLKELSSHESENFWKIHLVLSEFFYQKGNSEDALEHAQVSYRYAPSQKKEDVSDLIEQISMKTYGEFP